MKIVHTKVDRKMRAEKIMLWKVEEGFFGLILRPILSGKEIKVKKHSNYQPFESILEQQQQSSLLPFVSIVKLLF